MNGTIPNSRNKTETLIDYYDTNSPRGTASIGRSRVRDSGQVVGGQPRTPGRGGGRRLGVSSGGDAPVTVGAATAGRRA